MDDGDIAVKLDLSNAFNSLYRDRMLASVYEILHDLAAYCFQVYAKKSTLKFDGYTGQSRVDSQQGDSLRPLLFRLPLQLTLLQLGSPLSFGYLDDLTPG